MSSEPDPAPLGVDEASVAAEQFRLAQVIVKLICEGQICWDDLVTLHREKPVVSRFVLVELRTAEERELAEQLETYLADNYSEEPGFDEIRHTVVTHLIDRYPPSFLRAKAQELTPKE